MFTREAYEKIGNYDTEKFLVEDYDYWLRIARIFPVKYIDNSLYLYRIHAGSLTETKNKQMLEAKIGLLTDEISNGEGILSSSIKARIYREIAIAAFSLDKYALMKKSARQIKELTGNLDLLPVKIKISCVMGTYPTYLAKNIYKSLKKVRL